MRASFDETKVAAAPTHLPSRAIVDFLFDFSGPKYLFDDIYHFSIRHYQKHQNNRNMLPVVKFMLSTILNHTIDQEKPLLLVPEAITNGRLYYDLAEKHEKRIRAVRDGELSTYRMGEILDKRELTALTEKNKNRAMSRLEGFQKLFPEALAISPTGMEAMLKCITNEPGFSNYQMLRDEDFEAFWIGVCMASQMGGFSDEVAYSRNGNFETFALFQVRYGLIPFRPKADTEIFFPNKKSVTPHDYLEMLFAHMLDVVPRGFTTDLSVKMAMRIIMLEEMRCRKTAHPIWGALDRGLINQELKALAPTHDRDFNKLKRDVLLFMAEHNLGKDLTDKNGLAGYDGLEKFYHEKLTDIGTIVIGVPNMRHHNYVEKSAQNLDMDQALRDRDLISATIYQIPYQLDGDFFSARPKIFDENNFERCSYPEQLALRTLMGLIETPKASAEEKFSEQGHIFLLVDRRAGEAAAEYASERGVILPSDARGLSGTFRQTNFDEVVKSANIAKVIEFRDELQKLKPSSVIQTSENIEEDMENFRLYREAFVAPGPGRLSPQAKLAYMEEILRRSVRLAIFDSAWENSSTLLGLRIQARKIQLGLIPRPENMPRHSMIIADLTGKKSGYRPQSLADDLKSLTDYLEVLIDVKTEELPRPLVKALLETVCLTRCYYSEDANHRAGDNGSSLINWQSVPMMAKDGLEVRKAQIIELLGKAKNLILDQGVRALTLQDVDGKVEQIDADYIKARYDLDAQERIARSRRGNRGSYHKIRGFNAA